MANNPAKSFPRFNFDLRDGYKHITNYKQKIQLDPSGLLDKVPGIPKSKIELISITNNAIDSIEKKMRRLNSIVQDAVLLNSDKILSSLPTNSQNEPSFSTKETSLQPDCDALHIDHEKQFQFDLEDLPLYLHQPRFRKNNHSFCTAESTKHPEKSNKSDTTSVSSSEEKFGGSENRPSLDYHYNSLPETDHLYTPSTLSINTSDSSDSGVKVHSNSFNFFHPIPSNGTQDSSKFSTDYFSSVVEPSPQSQEICSHISLIFEPSSSLDSLMHQDIQDQLIPNEKIQLEWDLIIQNNVSTSQLDVNDLCASSFEETYESGLIWISCWEKSSTCQALNFLSTGASKLLYYPGFEPLRCPVAPNRKYKVGASRDALIVLADNGSLWHRTISPSLPLGTKWVRLSSPIDAEKLTSLSICSNNSIGWLSDIKGNAWILKLRDKTWIPVKHEEDFRFKLEQISVCPRNPSMVWSIDLEGNLYVRTAIFSHDDDDDIYLKGVSWLPVASPIRPTCIAVSSLTVWILNSSRIFYREGISPPTNFVGRKWIEVRPPTLVRDSLKQIKVSGNDDVWLVTQMGSVWQCYRSDKKLKQEYEDGWCVITGIS